MKMEQGMGQQLRARKRRGESMVLAFAVIGCLLVPASGQAHSSDDQVMRIEYYPNGLVSSTTLPDGSFTSYVYDAAQRLTDVVDSEGNSIHYTLDNAGNRTKEEVKGEDGILRKTLSQVYNQLGQLQTAKDAGNHATVFTYDINSNLDTTTDPLGRVTDNDYDSLNRLTKTIQDVGGIAATTQFKYDARDNLTEVVDPKGLATKYQYSAFGDLLRLESPDTGVTTYGYDSAGNRTSALDARGELSTYTYDGLNRLTSITYSDATLNVTYTYDTVQADCEVFESFAVGRLTRMIDGSGETRYCHDRFGNMTRKVQVTNGLSFTMRYSYTKAGRIATIRYPDGLLVDYVRDGLGRTTEVGVTPNGDVRQVLMTDVAYHPFGPVAGWTFGNGRTMSRTLDLNYRPRTVLSSGTGSGGLNLGFAWDEAGNLASLHTSGLEQPPRITFGYDAMSRLTAFRDGPTGTTIETYTYDPNGDRTGFSNAGGAQSYTYSEDSHRLNMVNGVARTYDATGNTTSIAGTERQFSYNAAGKMDRVERNNVLAMQYRYTGKGEQVRRYGGVVSTYTIYSEAGEWMGDYGPAGQPDKQAVWLDGMLAGVVAGGRLYYIEADHIGTPRAVISAERDLAVWTWDLAGEAYGNSAPNQDPDTDGVPFVLDLRFHGQRFDSASGLNQNYFRNYDASTGRYVESDPIGLAGGLATYSYAGGAPTQAYDRYGLCWSNARAVGHYYGGGGRTVSLSETGCTSMVSSRVQPERNIWIAKVRAAAKSAAETMDCGTWQRILSSRSVGVSSGIFWIGGFSLLQDSNCVVQKQCGGTSDGFCARDSYSFECLLTSRMHDLFTNPSDFDNSARTSKPDFWDEYSYGGKQFYVDHSWYDSINGGGTL